MYPTDPLFPIFLILTIVFALLVGFYIVLIVLDKEIPPYEFKPKKTNWEIIQEREEKEYQKLCERAWNNIIKKSRNSFF